MRTFFEATAQQKKLADFGRSMMDFSENYGNLKGATDDLLRELNNLSHVGFMLTQVGAPFGTSVRDFTEQDQKLIVGFVQGTLPSQQ